MTGKLLRAPQTSVHVTGPTAGHCNAYYTTLLGIKFPDAQRPCIRARTLCPMVGFCWCKTAANLGIRSPRRATFIHFS